ncbi:MAG: peptidase T, partial [Solirubrobacteraceae bacterium]
MTQAPFTTPLAAELAADAVERLCRYVRVETQARREHEGTPSSPGQLELGRLLVEELHAIGVADAAVDERGYVMGTVPGGAPGAPVVGLLAHVDVSPDAPAAGVEPIVHRGYDGGIIELPRGGTVLDPSRMPELTSKVGHDIVTSSG